jgi:FkbM family methyltransferase
MNFSKNIIRKIVLYIFYPSTLRTDFFTLLNTPKAKPLGIRIYSPNYIFLNNFNQNSIIIDAGCGYLAEFSCGMIKEYGLHAYGIDPTIKHKPFLTELELKNNGRFKHIPVAISKNNGSITFHETLDNESGSLRNDHIHVLNDSIRTYQVDSMNLLTLLDHLNLKEVDLLKLDLEGAEYELLENITEEDLKPFKQIYIEFHHFAVKGYSKRDTYRIVKKIKALGFKSFSLEYVNYLFYK